VTTAASERVEQTSPTRPGHFLPRLIRQASLWLPAQDPERVSLQDMEGSDAIRWVDLYAGELRSPEALALLNPVCRGQLNARMARDLVTPKRFPAGREYEDGRIALTAAFRIRHLQRGDAVVTSVFEPVQLLIGEDWMLTSWLAPKVFRGRGEGTDEYADDASAALYLAVADAWPDGDNGTAGDLAALVRRELAIACGYRPRVSRPSTGSRFGLTGVTTNG
jgi:hypothetical protein